MSSFVLIVVYVAFVYAQQQCAEANQGVGCICTTSVAACVATPCTSAFSGVVSPVVPQTVPQQFTCGAGCLGATAVCCAFRACPGTAGTAGTPGSAGLSGVAGTSGTAGSVGTFGTSGTAGTVGTAGTAGLPGVIGVEGAVGTRGTSGTPGTRGSSGTAGSAGAIGAAGTIASAGSAGTSGSAGIRGTSGTAGAVGVAGTAGTAGLGGTSGTEGAVGTSGTAGTAGTAGLQGTAGTAGTAGELGTFGTAGTAGSVGSVGSRGTAGSAGNVGTSATAGTPGSAGTAGTEGTSGTAGSIATAGTSGLVGTAGTAGTAGSSGTRGTSGTIGTAGSAGVAGGACTGSQSISLSSSSDLVASGAPFTVTVGLNNPPAGGTIKVKVSLDSKVLQSTTALTATNGVPCAALGSHSFLCTVPTGVFSFSFDVQTSLNVQGFADISAFLSNAVVPLGNTDDCAFASRTVEVGFLQFGPAGGQCSCPTNGLITFNADGSCTAKCASRKRDEPEANAVAALVKRQLGVPGVRVLAEISVTYRRTDKYSSSFDSSSDSTSRCGPRVSFLVNNKRIWTNGAQVDFGVEGVVSGNVEFLVPLGVELRYLIDIKAKDCKGYSLSIWDPQYTVRTVGTGLTVNPDSPLQKL